MMREKVLALLLVLSLCGNAYLFFFHEPGSTPFFPHFNGNSTLTSLEVENGSNGVDLLPEGEGDGIPLLSFSEESTIIPDNITPETGDTDGVAGDGNESTPDMNGSPDLTPEHPDGIGNGTEGGTMMEEENITLTQGVEETNLTPTPAIPEPSLISYNSSPYGFSLRYPTNWTINEAPAGRTVLTLTAPVETSCDSESNQCYKYIANFTIEIDQRPTTTSLEEYFNRAVARLQIDYAITTTSKSAPALLSDARAYQIEYYTHDKRGNADRRYMQYYTIIDGKGYIISYFGPFSTWDDNVYHHNKADAQAIIDSFSLNRTYKHA